MLPYWLDEPFEEPERRRLAGPPDVAIVGAGITGCSAAYHLARAGARVVLYDERGIAEGASGRNGGLALRGCAAPYDVAVESMGREAAVELWTWTEQAIDRLQALAGDAFRRTGSLRVALDEGERDEIRREFEALVADGFAAEWEDHLEGPVAERADGAIRHPGDGVLQPARLVRRLAGLAVDAGVELRLLERVTSLDQTGADAVVVCTDGYPSGLLGDLEGLIVPTRGQVVATEPVDAAWYAVPHYGRHGFDYWHQTPDGRIVAGGFRDVNLASELTTVEETTPAVQSALEGLVGSLAGRPIRIDYRWAGIFGLVLDFLPVVGRLPGNARVWVAGGYSGHGNVLGFACGELVARSFLGEPYRVLELFDPARLIPS